MRPLLTFSPFLLSFALAAWALPHQPGRMPTHWGVSGQPDRWGSPAEALFLLPALLLGAALLMQVVRHTTDRGNAGLLNNATLGLGLLALLETTSLILGWDTIRTVLVGLGLLFMLLGNVMGRTQPSKFVGLRTPWVYLSRRAWHASQRRSGVWFFSLGGLLLLAGLLLPAAFLSPWVAPVALLGGVLGMVAYLTWASWHDWKTDPDPQPVQLR
ncbi:DUF1648 domain-containing protein [Deinococcus taeanensis]|uniref:DUF1648 domain-containing protein n=1 Tax=Deinococcus taeanensis TaxID=2737050 RepID=UPI001CDB8C6E|nr:DUF1648 domain-containing protein [Deinococcus taeanensis]UBV41876.1 DUF1648 domain-containing protein [Deinococcus taeanensis]